MTSNFRAWLGDVRDSLPCLIVVDRQCRDGLRTAQQASPPNENGKPQSFSELIDHFVYVGFTKIPHRERKRLLKEAKSRGVDLNPGRLKVE
jgi:hypothetical protein